MSTEFGAETVIPAGTAEAISLNGDMGTKMETQNRTAI
jgi:hypothetical protein